MTPQPVFQQMLIILIKEYMNLKFVKQAVKNLKHLPPAAPAITPINMDASKFGDVSNFLQFKYIKTSILK